MATSAQLALQPHRNNGLFSDHYLDGTLRGRPEWRTLRSEAEHAMRRVAELMLGHTSGESEARTEHELVRPVLELLGHTFEVQASLKTPSGTKTPDYVLYRDRTARDANIGRALIEELLTTGGLAVGEAKRWDRPLDVAFKGEDTDPSLSANPSYQIYYYMQHSGVEWGILTNGRLWRLYHKSTAHRLDRYYEVDLEALATGGDAEAFLYFYAFFRREAFEDQALGLSAILRESTEYARGVGESLKQQVYQALRHLAQGFLDYEANELEPEPETLREVYDASLILLYRLLFILYAEARDLLPVRESDGYRDSYSLQSIKHEVARNLDQGRRLLSGSAKLWPDLRELFGIINKGSPPLKVATFNGGLFDPERHPFLERYTVGDARLQAAIDMLARIGPAGQRQFVDYRDLAERHLGTIYEGLLEFHLEAIAREGEWSVALLTDKGERKATGSYYTPDYIVKYIVDRTVGPLLQRAVEGKETDGEKVAAVLALNVLDPAMGSGHFPVEATEYIARFLVGLDVAPEEVHADGEGELAYWKRRVVQSCIYGVDMNPLAVELAKLSLWLSTVAKDRPLSFLDHHLRTGNALVGARLSDLQADAGCRKKPGRRERQAAEAGQLSMLGDEAFRRSMGSAVGSMAAIEASPAETVQDVKEQERAYSELREGLTRRYASLADLATATHFGVEMDPSLLRFLAESASTPGAILPQSMRELLVRVSEAARGYRFFHWELEFPEVYFDEEGDHRAADAGFDAVIGNPPYVRQERLAPYKPYFQVAFGSFHSVADLYLYFYEQGLALLRAGGRLGYISSGTFARANFARAFRGLLPTVAQLEEIIDFGENQPFEGAEMVRPSIAILTKGRQASSFRSLFISDGVPQSLERAVADLGIESDAEALAQPEWVFQSASSTRLFRKVLGAGRPLAEVIDGRFYRGVTAGLNEAFIIDQATHNRLIQQDPGSADILKPVLQGEDLRPWYQEREGRWLIFARRGIDIDAYPAVRSHLERFRARLEPRPANWADSRPWPGRKQGVYRWYEIQDAVDYYAEFERPKIFWPDISKLPRFSWDEKGFYVGNTGYVLAGGDPALLGILQSRVSWFAISQVCQPLRLRAGLWQYRLLPQFMVRLPVPEIPGSERDGIADLATTITGLARSRYELHRRVRGRILTDLGAPGRELNQKLTAWWTLDFPAFRAELQKNFKRDLPPRERDDWEGLLTDRCAEHGRLTAEMVRLEEELNVRVYSLFGLTPAEIRIVEEITKYRYGEV